MSELLVKCRTQVFKAKGVHNAFRRCSKLSSPSDSHFQHKHSSKSSFFCPLQWAICDSITNPVVVTCNDQTFVFVQFLCEEAGYNQLWIHEEKNLFLDQTRAQNTSTDPAAGKIHLDAHTNTHTLALKILKPALDSESSGSSSLWVSSYLQHASAFILDGAVRRHVQTGHRVLTPTTPRQGAVRVIDTVGSRE